MGDKRDNAGPASADLSFHTVLEGAGKTVFGPGGIEASRKLQAWADVSRGDKILELSKGVGTCGLELAAERGCSVLFGGLDTARLEKTEAKAERMGLEPDLVRTRTMRMFDLDKDLGEFKCAIVEAQLTHYPTRKKTDFYKGLALHTSQLLLHEVCMRGVEEDSEKALSVKEEMGRALRVGFFPETEDRWKEILVDAGWHIEEEDAGPLKVIDPTRVLQDEGPVQTARILWKIATNGLLRSRVLSTRKLMVKNSDVLGCIVIKATRKD